LFSAAAIGEDDYVDDDDDDDDDDTILDMASRHAGHDAQTT
jgi:hypothetical protein